jgi:hypothetical protein
MDGMVDMDMGSSPSNHSRGYWPMKLFDSWCSMSDRHPVRCSILQFGGVSCVFVAVCLWAGSENALLTLWRMVRGWW